MSIGRRRGEEAVAGRVLLGLLTRLCNHVFRDYDVLDGERLVWRLCEKNGRGPECVPGFAERGDDGENSGLCKGLRP